MPTLAQKRAADAYNKVYAIAHQSEFEGIRKITEALLEVFHP
jgi:hypothetical protein